MSYYIGVIGDISLEETAKLNRNLNILISDAVELKEKYEDVDFDNSIYIVSGLILRGVTKVAYEIADSKHYKKVGIDSKLAKTYDDSFKNFTTVYEGDKFGDEDECFVKNIDILLLVNPTNRDRVKETFAKQKNIPILYFTKTGKVGGMVSARK